MARAKKLLADAGLAGGYAFELTIVNNPQERREGEIIQGMAKEAGFNITLVPQEFASALQDNDAGKHQAFLIGWSGRVDPDTEFHNFHACGASLNQSNVCDEDVDALLNKAREVSDQKERVDLYRKAWTRSAPAGTSSTSTTGATSSRSRRTSRATGRSRTA